MLDELTIRRRLRPLALVIAVWVIGVNCARAEGGIAVVRSSDHASYDQVVESLQAAVGTDAELIEINLRGKTKDWNRAAERIREQNPRLVLALGPMAARMTKQHLGELPLLYCMVSNPARYELAGDNIAGISLDVPGDVQFAAYRTLVPNLRTIGVIYDPSKSEQIVVQATAAAAAMGIELLSVPVTSHKKVLEALRGMLGKIDALWTVPDDTVLTTDSFRFLLITSLERKLPFLAISDIFVKVGALATMAPEPAQMGRQIAQLIGDLDRGEFDLSEVDIMAPASSQMVINRKTAEKIGLELSEEILRSAAKVY